jgi:membrane-bound lytic murein transglycosylase D
MSPQKQLAKNFFGLVAGLGLIWLGGCAVTTPLPVEPTQTAAQPALSAPAEAAQAVSVSLVPAPAPTLPAEAAPSVMPPRASTIAALAPATAPAATPVTTPEPSTLLPIMMADAGSMPITSLQAPTDLWDRIRRGYGMPNLESDLVRDREQWYRTRPDYLLRMTERSRKYLFHIVEELERRNMPTELALLPFVESAFNPQAVSSAKAMGMWQFMPATGKQYELKQNVFRDDRRDVLASTRAALDYLQRLYAMFGDWHLALAAYNWGEGNIGRAIAKNQQAGQPVRYTDLGMPMETRFYVPKLQAIKNMVADPAAFGSQLPPIDNHPFFQTVEIKRDIDVALAARLAGVSLDDFKALNPSLNRPVILAAGVPQILLPWDNALTFRSNLAAHGENRLASWTVWLAPATMRPADAARRVGMSEAELRRLNNIPPRMVIRAGSSLLVPRANKGETDVAVHLANHGQLSLGPEVTLQRRQVKAGKNDSVSSLAKRYSVSPGALADWNKVSTAATFKTGQTVVLFLPGTSQAKGAKKTITASKAAKPRSAPTVVAKR